MTIPEPVCTGTIVGPCDRPAVAAVHIHPGHGRPLPTILIRPDHLAQPDHAIEDWRCLDCLHWEIDVALAGKLGAQS